MNLERLEKIRKQFSPIYIFITIITLTGIFVGLIFLVLPTIKLKYYEYIIIAVSTIILIIILLMSMYKIDDMFQNKIKKPFLEELLTKMGNKKLNAKFIEDTKYESLTRLIKKGQKLKVIQKVCANDYTIYELSIWRDIKFRGLLLDIDISNSDRFEYLFINYKYFYKILVNEKNRVKTNWDFFNNRFKLYDATNRCRVDEKFAQKMHGLTSVFQSVGVEVVGNKLYILLKSKDKFFTPSVVTKIDEKIIPNLDMRLDICQKLSDLKLFFN